MKKLLAILLVAALVLSFASCAAKEATEETENTVGLPNPVVSYSSIEEINEKIGCTLSTPGAMGVTDETFSVISDEIAEYSFKMNGVTYVCRAGKTTDDITGLYVGEGTAFSTEPMVDRYWCVNVDNGLVGRWFDGDMQYTVYKDFGEDSADGVDYQDFEAVCDEFIARSCPETAAAINAIAGIHHDSVSGRATAEVTALGNYAVILINWSSSAYENDFWQMSVEFDGSKYVYNDCDHGRTTFTSEDESTNEWIGQYMEGYFELTEEGLVWSGASEEEVVGTIFVNAESGSGLGETATAVAG